MVIDYLYFSQPSRLYYLLSSHLPSLQSRVLSNSYKSLCAGPVTRGASRRAQAAQGRATRQDSESSFGSSAEETEESEYQSQASPSCEASEAGDDDDDDAEEHVQEATRPRPSRRIRRRT